MIDRVISLDEFLKSQFGATPEPPPDDALAPVDRVRRREQLMRRWLPAPVVRRLDRGFARSNTIHPDTARALYAITRASGARIVYETGTYWGFSTSILAAAVRDAGTVGAQVHSFDLYARAGHHIPRALRHWVVLHRGQPSVTSIPPLLAVAPPELFFQDSRHDYDGVADELRIVAPHLPPRAVILLHDWVLDDVRRATRDLLTGWIVARIAGDDPQQLGVAYRPRTGSASV